MSLAKLDMSYPFPAQAKARRKHARLELFAVLLGIVDGDSRDFAPERGDALEASDLRSLGMLVRRYFKLQFAGLKMAETLSPATSFARLQVGRGRFDANLLCRAADEVVFHWTKECDPAGYATRKRLLEDACEVDDKEPSKPPFIDCDRAALLCLGFARHERAHEHAYVQEKKAARALQRAIRRHVQHRREVEANTRAWTKLWEARPRPSEGGAHARAAVDLECFKAIVASADVEIEPFEVVECFKDYGETAEHIARETEKERLAHGERVQKALLIQSVVFRHNATKEARAGMRTPDELNALCHKAQVAVALHSWQALFHQSEAAFYEEHTLTEAKEIHLARMLEGARGEEVNRMAFLETVVEAHRLMVGSKTVKQERAEVIRATARATRGLKPMRNLSQSAARASVLAGMQSKATARQKALKQQAGAFAKRYSDVAQTIDDMQVAHEHGAAESFKRAHEADDPPAPTHKAEATVHK